MAAHASKNGLFLAMAFLTGTAVGLSFHRVALFTENRKNLFRVERLYSEGTHLVNPLLRVETPPGGDAELEAIRGYLETYLAQCIQSGEVSDVAVYLRNLNEGTWVGINEEWEFSAASLAKIPILFALLWKAQQDPSILAKPIRYETEIVPPATQLIFPEERLQVGSAYTVEDLLHRSIAYSDNVAGLLLLQQIDDKLFDQICSDLHLPTPNRASADYQLSAKSYSACFRILYSATYLNKELSEKALKLLTETAFRDGIVAGVPKNIAVAHKFGERGAGVAGMQLHDCGIVYDPGNPYLICIMTQGQDLGILKRKIKEISKIVYDYKSRHPRKNASATD